MRPEVSRAGGACTDLEAGESLGFVLECGDVVEPFHGVESRANATPRTQQFEGAALTGDADERAGDGADARTVDLGQIREVEQQIASTAGDDLAQATVEQVIICANRRPAVEVNDGDAGRFAS